MLELCQKHGVIKHNEVCPLWELPPSTEKEKRQKLQKITSFKSKSGHDLIVKHLDSPEHGQYKVFRVIAYFFQFFA